MEDPNDVFSTKREFLQMAGTLLEEVLNPRMLRMALEAAAAKLGIPDPAGAVEILLPSQNTIAKPARRRKEHGLDTEKKEKAKRALTTYNVFMTWFSDFASNYGHHPAIVKVKAEHPTIKPGAGLTAEFYKTLSEEQKEAVKKALSSYVGNLDAGSSSEVVKKYDTEHPDEPIAKLVGLEAKPEYKTDPAQMKKEAATARKQAENGGGTPLASNAQAPSTAAEQPTGVPAPTPSQPQAAADTTMAVPETAKGGKETEKKRRREEEAGAHKHQQAGDEHKPKKEKKDKEKKEKDKDKEKDKEKDKDKEKKEKKDKEGKDKEGKDKEGKDKESKSERKKEGKGSERKSDKKDKKDKKQKD